MGSTADVGPRSIWFCEAVPEALVAPRGVRLAHGVDDATNRGWNRIESCLVVFVVMP